MYCVENSRQRLVIIVSFWGIVAFSPGVLLSRRMSPPILSDVGTEKSPVARGHMRVTAGDIYSASRGYGFADGPLRSFVLRAPRYDLEYGMPLTEHFKSHGTALLIDGGCAGYGQFEYARYWFSI